jgi:hypothetical protein
MTPQAARSDARVTEEIRAPMGWLLGRTYRLAQLAWLPEVMEIIHRVIMHLDHFCALEECDPKKLESQVLPTRSLRYITVRLGVRGCDECRGSGRNPSGYPCKKCDGMGTL